MDHDGVYLPAAAAISALADLGLAASEAEVLHIPTEELGPGLPAAVPLLWDRKRQQPLGLGAHIEAHRLAPRQRSGTATVQTVQAFIALVNRHRDADSAVFANVDWQKPSLTAVIDYHCRENLTAHDDGTPLNEGHRPRHGGHRIHYAFPLSDAWTAWLEQNGKLMDQGDFALFVEDHIAELAAPTDAEKSDAQQFFQTRCAEPAELFTLARGLEVAVDSRVKSATKLQSGEAEVHFEEVHRDGQGERLTVPGLFILRMALFRMAEPVRLPVRLRYRVSGGAIKWGFQLHRPDERVTEAITRALDAVRVDTALPVYEGAPEA